MSCDVVELPDGSFGVQLMHGMVAVIDASSVDAVRQHTWTAVLHAKTSIVYAKTFINRLRAVKMHRFILGITDPKIVVDHIDGDGLNNRRENLRLCTNAENRRNSRLSKNNKSGFKGVSWNERKGKWRARIWLDNKEIALGYFFDPFLAALAYDAAAVRLYGAFARLNVPEAETVISTLGRGVLK